MSERDPKFLKCNLCGFPFRQQYTGRRFCSDACRQRAKRVRDGTLTPARAEELARDERAARSRAVAMNARAKRKQQHRMYNG